MSKTVYMRAKNGHVFSTEHPQYHKDCENLGSGSAGYSARQEYTRKELREFIKPGDTVYCLLRRVSNSGMSRNISFFVVQSSGIRCIDSLMSNACAISEAKGEGLRMHGCGMDMGFAGVYDLGRALYPEGFAMVGEHPTGKKLRPANKRQVTRAKARGYVFRGRNGSCSGWEYDGGYALTHTWL